MLDTLCLFQYQFTAFRLGKGDSIFPCGVMLCI